MTKKIDNVEYIVTTSAANVHVSLQPIWAQSYYVHCALMLPRQLCPVGVNSLNQSIYLLMELGLLLSRTLRCHSFISFLGNENKNNICLQMFLN